MWLATAADAVWSQAVHGTGRNIFSPPDSATPMRIKFGEAKKEIGLLFDPSERKCMLFPLFLSSIPFGVKKE